MWKVFIQTFYSFKKVLDVLRKQDEREQDGCCYFSNILLNGA